MRRQFVAFVTASINSAHLFLVCGRNHGFGQHRATSKAGARSRRKGLQTATGARDQNCVAQRRRVLSACIRLICAALSCPSATARRQNLAVCSINDSRELLIIFSFVRLPYNWLIDRTGLIGRPLITGDMRRRVTVRHRAAVMRTIRSKVSATSCRTIIRAS